jgi:vacuolar-type H+-ATPase subunit I/STV1
MTERWEQVEAAIAHLAAIASGHEGRISTLEQALTALAAGQVQAQQHMTELEQTVTATSRDVAHLVASQSQTDARLEQTDARLNQLVTISERFINASSAVVERLDRNVDELKAGQEQQVRVLDYLLRKEQERHNEI